MRKIIRNIMRLQKLAPAISAAAAGYAINANPRYPVCVLAGCPASLKYPITEKAQNAKIILIAVLAKAINMLSLMTGLVFKLYDP